MFIIFVSLFLSNLLLFYLFMFVITLWAMLYSMDRIRLFLIQEISSILLLLSMIYYFSLLPLALFVKMGVVPFHFWMMSILSGISSEGFIFIMSSMKVVPMILMFSLSVSNLFIYVIIFLATFLIFKAKSIKHLLVLSSSTALALLIFLGKNNGSISLLFLLLYLTLIYSLKTEEILSKTEWLLVILLSYPLFLLFYMKYYFSSMVSTIPGTAVMLLLILSSFSYFKLLSGKSEIFLILSIFTLPLFL